MPFFMERTMKVKIELGNLVLEITRKCNMSCSHCLRGPAQHIDMDTNIINRVTEALDHINGVVFTGGEPSLNAAAIEHFRWAIHFNRCSLGHFWLTVNARFYKQSFYNAIRELYCICDEQDSCSLTISRDQYHGKMSPKAYEMYAELPFFSNERMKRIAEYELLSEGNAKKNQMSSKEVRIAHEIKDYYMDEEEDTLYVGDVIYVNAKGDILLCCDLSFKHQKYHAIGNVLKESLENILIRCLYEKKQLVCV